MRIISLATLLAATAGCSANQMHFEQRSELESRTSSVVLYDDGQLGQGSMNEQTCQFDTRNGMIVRDIDLPTAEERVEDVRGNVVVARSIEGIHVLDENGWDKANDIALAGVLRVRMTDDGIASLIDDGGCRLDWRNDDTVVTTDLADEVCANVGDFVIDRPTGKAFVSFGTDVAMVTPEGSSMIGIEADLLAMDEVSGNVFAAKRGGDTISAFDQEGTLAWAVDAGGEVFDMTDFGALGASAAIVSTKSGARLKGFDGFGGQKIADYGMPGEAEVTVSADSSTIGLVTDERVFFYDVFEGTAPVVFNETETIPPPMFSD